jgi:hypothetical protein
MIFGSVLLLVSNFWLSLLSINSAYLADVLAPLVLFGIGIAFTTIPPTMLAASKLRESESGIASSVLNSVQTIGGSLGLAVLVSVATFASMAASSHPPAGPTPDAIADQIFVAGMSASFVAGTVFSAATILVALFVQRDRDSDLQSLNA